MKNHLTNQTIWTTDFSEAERKKAISRIKPYQPLPEVMLAPGISASNLIGTDVSLLDRRSVKAQLAGRGDFRALWWNINCAARLLFSKDATLETAMFGFHTFHHRITLFVLEVKQDVMTLRDGIVQHGVLRGIKHHYSN